jgi:hypothetical protein
MIGFRGCGRYADPFFEECFAMELEVRRWLAEAIYLAVLVNVEWRY